MHHELGELGRPDEVSWYFATALWKCLCRNKPPGLIQKCKNKSDGSSLQPSIIFFLVMCLPALNNKVMYQNCIQKRVFFHSLVSQVSYKVSGTAGNTFQGLTLPKKIFNNVKHSLSVHLQSESSWLSILMKLSLGLVVGFFSRRGGVTIAH